MVVVAVLVGLVMGAVTEPIAAPAVAVAVIAGCLVARSRPLFVLAPVGLLVATAVYMADRETQHHFPTVLEWPSQFPLANTLGWMAIAALVTGGAVEALRRRPGMAADQQRATTSVSAPLSASGPAVAADGAQDDGAPSAADAALVPAGAPDEADAVAADRSAEQADVEGREEAGPALDRPVEQEDERAFPIPLGEHSAPDDEGDTSSSGAELPRSEE